MVKIAAFVVGIVFLCVSAATANLANVYFSVTMLCLSYVYSAPPWRLKIRPPFDVVSAGILGFFAPFALGYSFVDDATALPLQAYYFTCCVMGFHAFSTIMDYDVDKRIGDRTFAVAYGKRAAALFPAAIFLCSLFIVRVNYIKIFFMACLGPVHRGGRHSIGKNRQIFFSGHVSGRHRYRERLDCVFVL